MQFEKVVRKRRSVRKFADRPVDTDLIKEVVMFAQRSPSWVNSQPWQVYCASGNSLAEIKRRYQQNNDQGVPTNPDLAVMSREQWAPQEQANMKQWGHQIVHHFPDFATAHATMTNASQSLYNSPVILFITIPKDSPDWSIFDAGAFTQTLLLTATNRGLGSIVTYNSVRYPAVLHQVLTVPNDQRFIVGVSLGYVADEPINHFRSDRVALNKLLHFR